MGLTVCIFLLKNVLFRKYNTDDTLKVIADQKIRKGIDFTWIYWIIVPIVNISSKQFEDAANVHKEMKSTNLNIAHSTFKPNKSEHIDKTIGKAYTHILG